MALLGNLRLRWRAAARGAAYDWGLELGMAPDRARAYSHMIYPPTLDDLAFENRAFPKPAPKCSFSLADYFAAGLKRRPAT
jgi:hypothetical protein